MVRLPRDRCYSFLLIFTFYLLLAMCLAIGLSYTDKQVHFVRWLSYNIGYANPSDGRMVPATPPTWEGLKGGEHCLRYATREYTARLSTDGIYQEAMRACKETPTEIHGRLLQTDFCQDLVRFQTSTSARFLTSISGRDWVGASGAFGLWISTNLLVRRLGVILSTL
jgi:hypothetical protein